MSKVSKLAVDVPILLLGSAVILAITWGLARLLNRIIKIAAARAGVPKRRIRNITQAITILSLSLGVAAVASYTGLASEFTVLTISGIAGLAISLSLQLTFQNIIAGVLLILDGALKVDDTVTISGISGQVVKIGLRNTWIRTQDGTIVIVGNSTLSSGPLVNHSAGARLSRRLGEA